MPADIITRTDERGRISIGHDPAHPDYTVDATDLDDARERVNSYARQVAEEWGAPVTVEATDPSGTFTFEVYPDGTTQETIPDVEAAQPAVVKAPAKTATPAPKPTAAPAPSPMPIAQETAPAPAAKESWWTRLVHALGGGAPQPVAVDESAPRREADRRTVARYWDRCMTVTVANAKGGVGKTPTSQQMAAAFALAGAGPVLYLEMNITRGTGSWTTERSDKHTATVHDFLAHLGEFETAESQLASFARFVHHQSADKYDVLNADPKLLSDAQQIAPDDFVRLHTILCRSYRVIVIDTGNDEGTDLWRSILNATDQLVVVSDTRIVSSATATAMLTGLDGWGGRYRTLSREAVVAVNQANGKRSATVLAEELGRMASGSIVIPYDDALNDAEDMIVHHADLEQQTQDAYLHLAALVATGFDAAERR